MLVLNPLLCEYPLCFSEEANEEALFVHIIEILRFNAMLLNLAAYDGLPGPSKPDTSSRQLS